jgi:hypothetical protein
MDNQQSITLHFLCDDGKRESAKLTNLTLAQARELANVALGTSAGLYTEVTICPESGRLETIQNPAIVGVR